MVDKALTQDSAQDTEVLGVDKTLYKVLYN